MSVVSTTMCYPGAGAPTQGVFVWRRLREVHRLMGIRVVAPVPWFPGLKGRGTDPLCGERDEPPVFRPRMFYVPGALKSLDGRFYARALERGLALCRAASDGTTACIPPQPPPNRGGRADVRLIEAHFVWPDGVGAWRVARRLGVPFVCTIRGKLVSQIADAGKRRQIREMLLAADGLIAVSRSLADLADEVAGRSLGVRVIPNGIDREMFRRLKPGAGSLGPSAEARRSIGRDGDAKYVVSVGHLQALKGFHRLVEIWPEVRRRVGDVRLVLVGGSAGEPAYERRLRRRIEADGLGAVEDLEAGGGVGRGALGGGTPRPRSGALGLSGRAITLMGRVDPGQVATLLNAADLFVLASRSEGWCNAIAEALACGCPVVATDVGGNREIVNDSALGRLVPLGDRDALVEAICGALGRRWDRSAIAKAGGGRDWQQVARECVDVFQDVLRDRP